MKVTYKDDLYIVTAVINQETNVFLSKLSIQHICKIVRTFFFYLNINSCKINIDKIMRKDRLKKKIRRQCWNYLLIVRIKEVFRQFNKYAESFINVILWICFSILKKNSIKLYIMYMCVRAHTYTG